MEERKSWLPAGLEGSGWEPDDRSSQRSGAGSKRSGGDADASSPRQPKAEKSPDSDRGPSASSGSWQPYDPDRPESKRARKDPESDEEDSRQREAPKSERSSARQEDRDRKDALDVRDRKDEDARGRDDDGRGRDDESKAARDRESDQEGRSDVDAMGQDKHRQVVGQRVGASRTKQLAYYGAFVAFVIVAYLGFKIAVDNLDKAPAHDKAQAPWSQKKAPDQPLGGFTPKTKGEKGPTNFQ